MRYSIIIFMALVLFGCTEFPQSKEKSQDMAIVSKEIILQKAEEKFVEIYGDTVLKQRPFIVTESDSYWKVEGTFHCPEDHVCKGGVVEAVFDRFTGDLKSITHGK